MVMISERPAEAKDRAVPGHWEGDLIIGRRLTTVGTLVERSTRYVMLLRPPQRPQCRGGAHGNGQEDPLAPHRARRSLTWDQGKEMVEHAPVQRRHRRPVYFCDPKSPGSAAVNENTNGLLRQYMPKGTDLSVHSKEDLDRFARSLNNRPRETLGFMKPSEKLTELLALTG